MQSVIVQSAQPDATTAAPPVVTARDLVRRYGDGDTAVDALGGMSDAEQDDPPLGKWTLAIPMSAIRTAATAVASNQLPPPGLNDLAADVDEPLLLIAAPNAPNGERLNRRFHAAAPNSTLWEVPEAGHVGAIDARPEEYERRIVGFVNAALK